MGIRIKQATKDGYIEVADGGIVDLSYPNSKTRRGRVQGGGMLCPTITASANGLFRVEVLYGRDCDALRRDMGEAERAEQTDMGCRRNSTDIDSDLRWRSASEGLQERERERESMEPREVYRRLTPKEYWRLMGFSDEDYEKAATVNSPTQLYKQAGNSIVVNVLMAIFKEML